MPPGSIKVANNYVYSSPVGSVEMEVIVAFPTSYLALTAVVNADWNPRRRPQRKMALAER
jgi:hypothetical protein